MSSTDLLSKVKIASPCNARWEDMAGDERSRFCGRCEKHVYNFSAMSADEVAGLVRAKEGKLCGRFHRRRDGTMLTANCPIGFQRYCLRLKTIVAAGAVLLMTAFSVRAWSDDDESRSRSKGRLAERWDNAVWKVKGWLGLNPPPVMLGDICVPAPPGTNGLFLGKVSLPPTNTSLMGEISVPSQSVNSTP